MISFKFIEDIRTNFTPSTKIIQYAKANALKCFRTHFGSLILEYEGRDYSFDHYTITDNGNGTETVEIFLALI